MKHYIDFAELRRDFPATCQMVENENEGQHPCATFEDTTTSNDMYWGCGADGTGQNMLGKVLMEVREELKGE
jgi:hypothetical protein